MAMRLSCLLPATLVAVFLVGCSDPNAQARGEFLSGCVQGGGQKALCQCTFERLEKRYTPQELQQLALPGGRPPKDFLREATQAAMACRSS